MKIIRLEQKLKSRVNDSGLARKFLAIQGAPSSDYKLPPSSKTISTWPDSVVNPALDHERFNIRDNKKPTLANVSPLGDQHVRQTYKTKKSLSETAYDTNPEMGAGAEQASSLSCSMILQSKLNKTSLQTLHIQQQEVAKSTEPNQENFYASRQEQESLPHWPHVSKVCKPRHSKELATGFHPDYQTPNRTKPMELSLKKEMTAGRMEESTRKAAKNLSSKEYALSNSKQEIPIRNGRSIPLYPQKEQETHNYNCVRSREYKHINPDETKQSCTEEVSCHIPKECGANSMKKSRDSNRATSLDRLASNPTLNTTSRARDLLRHSPLDSQSIRGPSQTLKQYEKRKGPPMRKTDDVPTPENKSAYDNALEIIRDQTYNLRKVTPVSRRKAARGRHNPPRPSNGSTIRRRLHRRRQFVQSSDDNGSA